MELKRKEEKHEDQEDKMLSHGIDGDKVVYPILMDANGRPYVVISDGTETATVTAEGYLDVKTHTPEKCFTHDYADAQSNVVIITPTAGKKIRIVSVYSSVGANATNVTLTFGTSGNIFFKHYTEKKSTTVGNVICATGATNETVKLTCPGTTFISIGYDEVS